MLLALALLVAAPAQTYSSPSLNDISDTLPQGTVA